MAYVPVSYTHLDVYKRQGPREDVEWADMAALHPFRLFRQRQRFLPCRHGRHARLHRRGHFEGAGPRLLDLIGGAYQRKSRPARGGERSRTWQRERKSSGGGRAAAP